MNSNRGNAEALRVLFNNFSKRQQAYEIAILNLQEHLYEIKRISNLIKDDEVLSSLNEIDSLITDIVTENTKALVFVEEFTEKLANEKPILKEEYDSFVFVNNLAENAIDFETKVDAYLGTIKGKFSYEINS